MAKIINVHFTYGFVLALLHNSEQCTKRFAHAERPRSHTHTHMEKVKVSQYQTPML